MPDIRIQVRDLAVQFGPLGDDAVVALAATNLDVRDGELVALIGPSGCGKSTLLNVIAGLLRPTRGEVRIDGETVAGVSRKVGYMFQKDTLLPWATVRKNVMLPMEAQARPAQRVPARVDATLASMGLQGFGDHYPYQLSGGMRKRVQFGRLLIQDPAILLLDEPFGALDAQTRLLMQELFLSIWEQDKKTAVLITHDLHEAIWMSDVVYLMSRPPGRIKEIYPIDSPRPRKLRSMMNSREYADLFGTMWDSLREELDSLRQDLEAGVASSEQVST